MRALSASIAERLLDSREGGLSSRNSSRFRAGDSVGGVLKGKCLQQPADFSEKLSFFVQNLFHLFLFNTIYQ